MLQLVWFVETSKKIPIRNLNKIRFRYLLVFTYHKMINTFIIYN